MNENPKPYQAIIKGKRCKIAWDENHDNVLLVDGVPHEVGVLEQSLDVLRKQRLLSISELKFGGSTSRAPKGWWLVEGKHPGHWIIEASGDSRRLTYEYLDQVLSKDKRPARFTEGQLPLPTVVELRTSAVAVAFVKEQRICFDDGKSILAPVFLSRFKPMNKIPYPAEINGEQVGVKGWDEQENLLLANGERYEFEPVKKPSFKIAMRRLVSVRSLVWKNDEWVVDGDGLHGWLNDELARVADTVNRSRVARRLSKLPLLVAAVGTDDQERRKFHPLFGERQALDRFLNSEGCRDVDPNSVSHVAWFDGIEDPVLLRSFRLLPSDAKPQENKKAAFKTAPETFTNLADAANYAKVTERTIKNWKRDGWLKFEQVGKKVRINKTDLDKCIRKQ